MTKRRDEHDAPHAYATRWNWRSRSPKTAPASMRPFAGSAACSTPKRRRRDEQAENDHPAEPDDERRQRHVPDREHPVIIIAAVDCGRARPDHRRGCCERWRTSARPSAPPPARSCCAATLPRADEYRERARRRRLARALDRPSARRLADRRIGCCCSPRPLQVSDDDRLRRRRCRSAADGCAADWPSRGAVAEPCATVDACLPPAPLSAPSRASIVGRDRRAGTRGRPSPIEPGEGLPQTLSTPNADARRSARSRGRRDRRCSPRTT